METKLNKYKLNQGDIVRIGRITSRIKDIVFNNNTDENSKSNIIKLDENIKLEEMSPSKTCPKSQKKQMENYKEENDLETENNQNKINNVKKVKKVCRICYIEEDDENNPLLQPCTCSGSMKYIHLTCLKHWISTRSFDKIDSNENCTIFIIKPVECELCKTKFPDFVRHKGKLYTLLEYRYEYKSYFTLESLTLDKHKNKFLYVVSLDNLKKIKLGRGHDANIILGDISVSRIHSIISVENKNLYIQDNNSKFGTLVLCQTPIIKLAENLPLYIQVSRTFFVFLLKKLEKMFNCCGVSERPNLYYYHKQNQNQINNKRLLTVKTENDDDNSVSEECVETNEIFDDKNLIEENKNFYENKNNNNIKKKKLNKNFGNKGTMLYDDNDLEVADEESKKDDINLIKEDINGEENNNSIGENADDKEVENCKKSDKKSESIIIEDE